MFLTFCKSGRGFTTTRERWTSGSNTTKIPREDPPEREKERKWGCEEKKKKREIWAPHPSGPHSSNFYHVVHLFLVRILFFFFPQRTTEGKWSVRQITKPTTKLGAVKTNEPPVVENLAPSTPPGPRCSSKEDAKARATAHDSSEHQRKRHPWSALIWRTRGSARALAFARCLMKDIASSDHLPATSLATLCTPQPEASECQRKGRRLLRYLCTEIDWDRQYVGWSSTATTPHHVTQRTRENSHAWCVAACCVMFK